jgi:hypothetical protein
MIPGRCLRGIAAALFFFACAPPADAFEGKVVDSTTGASIADATIGIGDQTVRSDPGGRFRIDAEGERVQLRAPGYRAATITTAEARKMDGVLRLAPFLPKALYLSFYGIGSKSLREAALKLLRDAALNALVIDVKGDRGMISYRSAVPLATAVGAQRVITIPDLPDLLRMLHEAGIYVIARIVVFKDDPLATARPDLAIKEENGSVFHDREGLAWTDPFLQEVRDYNVAIAVEAARAGFDEIQFDYLRFPDTPRLRFARPSTETSRIEAIASLLTQARRQLAPFNVYLAADIFGYVCWNENDTGIGQRLEELMPLVDYLSPMLYPSGFQFGIPGYSNPVAHPYEIVRLSLEQARVRTGVSPRRFRPWLQAFRDYAFDRRVFDADEVAAQIRAATEFGSDGWMLWDPRNIYSDTGLKP